MSALLSDKSFETELNNVVSNIKYRLPHIINCKFISDHYRGIFQSAHLKNCFSVMSLVVTCTLLRWAFYLIYKFRDLWKKQINSFPDIIMFYLFPL